MYAPGPYGLGVIRFDPGDCLIERLTGDGHVPGISVYEVMRVRHDADVALPEDEIAAPEGA